MTTQTSNHLTEAALLIRVTVHQWGAKTIDKNLIQEAATNHSGNSDIAEIHKRVWPKPSLRRISALTAEIRAGVKLRTSPWDDTGLRLIPSSDFLDFSSWLREVTSRFEDAVRKEFISDYQDNLNSIPEQIGDLFDASQYPPDGRELAARFWVGTDISQVPSEDWRVKLSGDADEVLAEMTNLETLSRDKLQDAWIRSETYNWERLEDAVTKFAQLDVSDPKLSAKRSMITNLEDLVARVPGMNFSKNPKLDDVVRLCKSYLLRHDWEKLRDNISARGYTKTQATSILTIIQTSKPR